MPAHYPYEVVLQVRYKTGPDEWELLDNVILALGAEYMEVKGLFIDHLAAMAKAVVTPPKASQS